MGTGGIYVGINNKSASTLKFRLNLELKQDFKKLADRKGTTMSKLLNDYIELELKKDKIYGDVEAIEERILRCDDLLRNKQKQLQQPIVKPKGFFKWFSLWNTK